MKGRSGDRNWRERERERRSMGPIVRDFERKNNHFAGWLIEMGGRGGERVVDGSILCPDLCVDVCLISFMGE